jgi:hypothetical protein
MSDDRDVDRRRVEEERRKAAEQAEQERIQKDGDKKK